jgi:hypothetical protein
MNLFLTCIHLIIEFIESNQGTDDVSSPSKSLKVADKSVMLKTPKHPPQKILFESRHPLQQSQSQLKDTGLFLSPATEKFHTSIDKATKLSEVVYNSRTLKEVQKNIIQSIDYILNHDLVSEHPAAASFVGTSERNMQGIEDKFNKVVLSSFGANVGKDNEVCFPSYKNKKKKQVEKLYKGIAG